MRQLSGQDASFVYMESQNAHLHLTSVHVYDRSTVPGGFTEPDIRQYIKSRMHTSPIFRQKLMLLPMNLDYPYWVDDECFRPDAHIRHRVLPQPGDWRQLREAVAEIHTASLDLSRPAWDMHIIEGLTNVEGVPEDAFALVSRYHHAAIDGVSGTAVLTGLHRMTPEHDPDPKPKPWEPEPRPSWLRFMNQAAINNVRVPLQFAKAVAGAMPGFGRAALHNVFPDVDAPDKVPETRFNAAVSPHRVFDAAAFSLRELAARRNAVPGATVNDVILAICGGALRDYLGGRGELPDESLIAIAPINTRTDEDVEEGGNVIAMMFVPLHTDIEDPVSRLRAVYEATVDAKAAKDAISARQMTDIAQHVPAATEALAGRLINGLGLGYRGPRFANCTVSNVPGPQQPMYLNGAKLTRMMGVGPVIDGVGLMFTALSYDGRIELTISGCRDITPDPEHLADCLRSAYHAFPAR